MYIHIINILYVTFRLDTSKLSNHMYSTLVTLFLRVCLGENL